MKRKFISACLALILCISLAVTVSAEGEHLFDDAGLLTDYEALIVEQTLAEYSDAYQAQLVVCTVYSLQGENIDRYLNDLYDSMDFGYGAGRDGVLLLVCMEAREYRILSNGFAGSAIDTGVIEEIGDVIVSDLSEGDYAEAFVGFAEQCGYYLEGHFNGYPFSAGKSLLICLVIGLLVGLIVAFVLKAQLKSVRWQNQANVYLKTGSMKITGRKDIFLYRNVSRTKKESSSSSGSSRSTGGGSF